MQITDQIQKKDRPLLVFVLATLSLIAGILGLLIGLLICAGFLFLSITLPGGGNFMYDAVKSSAFFFIPISSIALIFLAVGLFRMKQWSVYNYSLFALADIGFNFIDYYFFDFSFPKLKIARTAVVVLGAIILWIQRDRLIETTEKNYFTLIKFTLFLVVLPAILYLFVSSLEAT